MTACRVAMLGQSGVRLALGRTVFYIDPYLSDSVRILEGQPDLARLVPPPFPPDAVHDADYLLLTHLHLDHCDPHTVPKVLASSPQARVICPNEVRKRLIELGIEAHRITTGSATPIPCSADTCVTAVPAAHPTLERDADGHWRCLGFVLQHATRRLYHAGDTSPHAEIAAAVRALGPIDAAFLPVNERNYYKERRGILGNMSVREAFQFAEEIGAKTMVPMHWDMFAPNSVHPEEIELVYRYDQPHFELRLRPTEI